MVSVGFAVVGLAVVGLAVVGRVVVGLTVVGCNKAFNNFDNKISNMNISKKSKKLIT